MKTLTQFDKSTPTFSTQASSKTKSKKNLDPPQRQKLSPSEIREKVELASQGKLPKPKANTEVAEGEATTNDVANNTPNDPITQEKLKKVLSTNAFNFSEQERQVLENILK